MESQINQQVHFKSFDEVEKAFYDEFDKLIEHSVISTLVAQKASQRNVPRPWVHVESCLDKGVDLVDAGAKYNLGPVLTGID